MAPIKFDENIRNTLEKRTLNPSPNAWDKLSSRLDNHENKKKSKMFWYMGIAASIIGMLFVINGFDFKSEIPVVQEQTVFDLESTDTNNQINKDIYKSNEKEQAHENNSKQSNQKQLNNFNSQLASQQIKQPKEKIKRTKEHKTRSEVAHNPNAKIGKNKQLERINANEGNGLHEDSKMERIAINSQQELMEKMDLDAEIELLLNEAQLQVNSEKTIRSIDASSLLQDVEDDLEQSFRDKVFESLKTNFKKVTTAVADRNN